MILLPLLVLNIGLGLLNLYLFSVMRARGNSGIFQACVSVFNFSTAAFIAFVVYTK